MNVRLADETRTTEFRATAEYLREVGTHVEHINAKTEDWALELHRLLGKIQDTLPELGPEVQVYFQEASAQLQRQDIVRQELESVGTSLKSGADALEQLMVAKDQGSAPADLGQVLDGLKPRVDIDAQDVAEHTVEANVELF